MARRSTRGRVKHNIDRLLGNRHLAAERVERYQALARRLVGVLPEPPIVVDWTDSTPNRRCRIPRAASCLARCDLRILIVTQYSWPENSSACRSFRAAGSASASASRVFCSNAGGKNWWL